MFRKNSQENAQKKKDRKAKSVIKNDTKTNFTYITLEILFEICISWLWLDNIFVGVNITDYAI